MATRNHQILIRPPDPRIANTLRWLAIERKKSLNTITSDLLALALSRLNIPLRDDPPPETPPEASK